MPGDKKGKTSIKNKPTFTGKPIIAYWDTDREQRLKERNANKSMAADVGKSSTGETVSLAAESQNLLLSPPQSDDDGNPEVKSPTIVPLPKD